MLVSDIGVYYAEVERYDMPAFITPGEYCGFYRIFESRMIDLGIEADLQLIQIRVWIKTGRPTYRAPLTLKEAQHLVELFVG